MRGYFDKESGRLQLRPGGFQFPDGLAHLWFVRVGLCEHLFQRGQLVPNWFLGLAAQLRSRRSWWICGAFTSDKFFNHALAGIPFVGRNLPSLSRLKFADEFAHLFLQVIDLCRLKMIQSPAK